MYYLASDLASLNEKWHRFVWVVASESVRVFYQSCDGVLQKCSILSRYARLNRYVHLYYRSIFTFFFLFAIKIWHTVEIRHYSHNKLTHHLLFKNKSKIRCVCGTVWPRSRLQRQLHPGYWWLESACCTKHEAQCVATLSPNMVKVAYNKYDRWVDKPKPASFYILKREW